MSELRMKMVGQRKIESSNVWSAVQQLTETAERIRGTRALIPRGVQRFTTFEEAHEWNAGDDREYSRQPRPEDLAKICAALNRERARYLLIGGFAVIAYGLERPTKDIDLLIDASPENVDRVKRALAVLPDNAVRAVSADEVGRYEVVRVADEVVVDLMAKACGITWEEAARDSEILELDGVEIPIVGIDTLIRTKLTVRPHDAADREYLERLRRR